MAATQGFNEIFVHLRVVSPALFSLPPLHPLSLVLAYSLAFLDCLQLIGVWAMCVWHQLGRPSRLQLVELGPGRGALMADLLRVMCPYTYTTILFGKQRSQHMNPGYGALTLIESIRLYGKQSKQHMNPTYQP